MQKAGKTIPIFYTRGLNAPYTEGHIQTVNMIVRSLFLFGIRSVIFNFKYHTEKTEAEDSFVDRCRIEQKVPIADREDVITGQNKAMTAYSLIMETLTVPKFLVLENILKHRNCVVNVVNCFRYPRIFAKKVLKAPIILHFYMPQLRGQPMLRVLAKEADLIIASSHSVAEHLEERGIEKSKITIMYPPVDTELYKPKCGDAVRSEFGLTDKSRVILYIGSLKPTRFPEDTVLGVLRELVKEIPETVMLVFAAESALNLRRAQEIRRKAEILNLKDKLQIHIENLSERKKANAYSASDIFFFPEHSTRVAVDPPLTVLEAMASGKTVFAPKLSSASEIIADNENGFLFEQEDLHALTGRFADLLLNEELRDKISRHARHTVEQKMSLMTVGAKMMEHFTTLRNNQKNRI